MAQELSRTPKGFSRPLTHISGQKLLRVIDGGHRHLSLRYEGIVVGVVGNQQHVCAKQGGRGRGAGEEVENGEEGNTEEEWREIGQGGDREEDGQ